MGLETENDRLFLNLFVMLHQYTKRGYHRDGSIPDATMRGAISGPQFPKVMWKQNQNSNNGGKNQ
jgi:hypothetical protein